MNPPTIVIIGAGSAVFGLRALAAILRTPELRGVDLRLVDVDEPNLEVMARAAESMSAAWGSQARVSATTDRRAALPGAHIVIVSVQVGPREQVWEQDWRIPLNHGVRQPYAENSGPGALAHAARNLPLIMAIARDMEQLCPDALYMNYVNPLIRLTTAISRYTSLKVVGMCHQLLWGYAMAMALLADRYGITLPPGLKIDTNHANRHFREPLMKAGLEHLDIKAAGINHFSWVYDIRDRDTGEDLYPLLRERWLARDDMADFEPLSREVFRIFGLMPTPSDSHLCEFLPWVHDPVTKPWERYGLEPQNWQGNHARRAARREMARAVAGGDPEMLERLRGERGEGIPEVAVGVHFNKNIYIDQLNLPNNGVIPNLPAGAIVEAPGIAGAMGLRGLSMPALPEPIAELCRRELAYSSLVVDACYHGDKDAALQALLLDPLINDIETAKAILSDLLAEFQQYLPQF